MISSMPGSSWRNVRLAQNASAPMLSTKMTSERD